MKHFLGKNNVRLKKHVNFVIYILFLYFCRPFFNIIQMYAIVEIAGQQFKVSEKQEVFINRIDSKEGSKIILDKVLLLDKDGKIDVGIPTLKGIGVTAKIVEHIKSDKVLVFKDQIFSYLFRLLILQVLHQLIFECSEFHFVLSD